MRAFISHGLRPYRQQHQNDPCARREHRCGNDSRHYGCRHCASTVDQDTRQKRTPPTLRLLASTGFFRENRASDPKKHPLQFQPLDVYKHKPIYLKIDKITKATMIRYHPKGFNVWLPRKRRKNFMASHAAIKDTTNPTPNVVASDTWSIGRFW